MASKYGLNFGFRRSDETMAVREGRLRTPATGTFRLGSLVTFDPAAVGYLKAAAAAEVGTGATVGLLVQDEQFILPIYGPAAIGIDSHYWGVAKNNTLSVIWGGAGTKVWYRNTPAINRHDGTVAPAVTMFTATSLVIGSYMKWDGTKFVISAATDPSSDSMLRVTAVNTTATTTSLAYVEAVLTR